MAFVIKQSYVFLQDENLIRGYLDRNLTSRLGIRIMTTHHLKLREDKVSQTFEILNFCVAEYFVAYGAEPHCNNPNKTLLISAFNKNLQSHIRIWFKIEQKNGCFWILT